MYERSEYINYSEAGNKYTSTASIFITLYSKEKQGAAGADLICKGRRPAANETRRPAGPTMSPAFHIVINFDQIPVYR